MHDAPRLHARSPVVAPASGPDEGRQGSDRQFIALLTGFRNSGGLARAQEVATRCKARDEACVLALARWVLAGEVVRVEWGQQIWLPLFQFDPRDMSRRAGLGDALAELSLPPGSWELARWFSAANTWLEELSPAEVLAHDSAAVLQAARAKSLGVMGASQVTGPFWRHPVGQAAV